MWKGHGGREAAGAGDGFGLLLRFFARHRQARLHAQMAVVALAGPPFKANSDKANPEPDRARIGRRQPPSLTASRRSQPVIAHGKKKIF